MILSCARPGLQAWAIGVQSSLIYPQQPDGLTMTLIRPFAGLRPVDERAADVLAPPYDVLSTAEARARARGRPWSFLHISKAEIDLPETTDPYAPEVYTAAAGNLQRMIQEGILVRDSEPCYYIYRLVMGDHRQTGLVAAASVAGRYSRSLVTAVGTAPVPPAIDRPGTRSGRHSG